MWIWTRGSRRTWTISMNSFLTPEAAAGRGLHPDAGQSGSARGGEETFAFLQTIHREAERYYDADSVYLVGDSTSDYDLSVSFARDNIMISVLSVVFVIIVLLFTFQSVGLPILLILVIQGSIWINFSFPGMAQKPIFFLSYLIVTAIQMGANIDYAIVISSWYNELKAEMSRREAIVQALNLSFPTVLTSGSILSAAGFLISQITTEPAIVGIGECLCRGTLISMFLVMFILPQILYVGDKSVEKDPLQHQSSGGQPQRQRHRLCKWPGPGPGVRCGGRPHPRRDLRRRLRDTGDWKLPDQGGSKSR